MLDESEARDPLSSSNSIVVPSALSSLSCESVELPAEPLRRSA
jgi:hypothetical protein